MQLVGREFTEKITEYKDIWLPARAIVQRALESRFQVRLLITSYTTVHCIQVIIVAGIFLPVISSPTCFYYHRDIFTIACKPCMYILDLNFYRLNLQLHVHDSKSLVDRSCILFRLMRAVRSFAWSRAVHGRSTSTC